ncbi:hypothetical protein EMCRGX_G010401 [Ephydatia muelleri]
MHIHVFSADQHATCRVRLRIVRLDTVAKIKYAGAADVVAVVLLPSQSVAKRGLGSENRNISRLVANEGRPRQAAAVLTYKALLTLYHGTSTIFE